jgi:hypothetical protein
MRVTRSLLKGLHLRPDRRDDRGHARPSSAAAILIPKPDAPAMKRIEDGAW